MKAFPVHNDVPEDDDYEGVDLTDYFAAHAGKEAIELLNLYYGNDWMGSNINDAIETLAKTKLDIAYQMKKKR